MVTTNSPENILVNSITASKRCTVTSDQDLTSATWEIGSDLMITMLWRVRVTDDAVMGAGTRCAAETWDQEVTTPWRERWGELTRLCSWCTGWRQPWTLTNCSTCSACSQYRNVNKVAIGERIRTQKWGECYSEALVSPIRYPQSLHLPANRPKSPIGGDALEVATTDMSTLDGEKVGQVASDIESCALLPRIHHPFIATSRQDNPSVS